MTERKEDYECEEHGWISPWYPCPQCDMMVQPVEHYEPVPSGTETKIRLPVELEISVEILVRRGLNRETVSNALEEYLRASLDPAKLPKLVANYIAGEPLVSQSQPAGELKGTIQYGRGSQEAKPLFHKGKPRRIGNVIVNPDSGAGMRPPGGTFKKKKEGEDAGS